MRSNFFNAGRVIAINVLVLFVLANIAYWAIPVVTVARNTFWSTAEVDDPRMNLPNYVDSPWAKQHFREFAALTMKHMSYIGWRRKEFTGQTITVGGRYLQRRTVNNRNDKDATAYFFGGSTMWGTGAPDDQTIPSQFNAITGIHAENFGESAYVARQNLVMLIQLLEDGKRPNLVFFYDGANDVIAKCRRDATPASYYREAELVASLERSKIKDQSFAYFLRPLFSVAADIRQKLTTDSARPFPIYDCHESPKKSAAIAEGLIRDWTIAQQLVEAYGGQFIAALQPVAYFSSTRKGHIYLSKELEAQYDAVYPLIKQRLMRHKHFYDLTDALDVDEFVYIDFCHVSPNGNRRIASRLAAIAKNRIER